MPALSAAQRMAAAHERQRQALEAPGIRLMTVLARRMVVDAIKALRSGQSVYPAVQRFARLMEPIFRGAMTAAHLQGRIDAVTTASAALARRARKAIALYSEFGPYEKAVEALKARQQLTSTQLSEIEKLYGDTALRVTRNLGRSIEKKCQTAAAEIVAKGMHVNEATARMRQAFKSAGVLPQVVVQGQTRPAIFLLETLARTQVQIAYGAGRWNANQDPAIQEILWGYEYSAVMDERTRPAHAALDGLRAPKDDAIWGKIFPPSGWNCRCSTLNIYHGDAEAQTDMKGVDDKKIADATAGGWDYNPGEVFNDGLAEKAIVPEIIRKMLREK
ncbi:MAG: minor capsid protein [Planctomycetes bacterium]|nr:minor capsid protein [Planctomycetota bacterium]